MLRLDIGWARMCFGLVFGIFTRLFYDNIAGGILRARPMVECILLSKIFRLRSVVRWWFALGLLHGKVKEMAEHGRNKLKELYRHSHRRARSSVSRKWRACPRGAGFVWGKLVVLVAFLLCFPVF